MGIWGKKEQPTVRTMQAPTPEPPPKPDPLPSPTPTEIAPTQTAEQKRKRIQAVRYGILSTIKTSPLGIVGAGADLTSGRGKNVLGA